MPKLTEAAIEELALEGLAQLGYSRVYGPDIVLFVNGLPLVVIELKNAADESATITTAFQQLQTCKHVIPSPAQAHER